MAPFLLVGAAAAAYYWFMGKGKSGAKQLPSPSSHDPFNPHNIPVNVGGQPTKKSVITLKGHTYKISTWPIQDIGGQQAQYAVAQLQGSDAWLSYVHAVKTKKRKLYRGYAPGSKKQADQTMANMMGALGVKK